MAVPPPAPRTWTVAELLGDHTLDEVAGRTMDGAAPELTADRYAFGSPATGGLVRVRARTADGAPWSAFVKVLQHVRHWPTLALLPPDAAVAFAEMFPWQEELGLWRPAMTDRFPAGLRAPALYRVADLGDDRLALWTEEVDVDDRPWDDGRFARAAYLLGVLNARMCDPEVVAEQALPAGFALRQWASFGLAGQGLGPLADDALWSLPPLVSHAGLRDELRAAVPLVERVLDAFAALRQGMPHGDASPQNLLVPRGGPAEFVVIDISFQTPAPLGSDLGQLVVGLAHAGLLAPERLPAVEAVVLDAYRAGVADAGPPPANDDIALGYAGSLLVRSGFTAIPYALAGDPSREAEVRDRLALTAFVLATARRHLAPLSG